MCCGRGGVLELFATEGLNREAVHKTPCCTRRGPCRPDRARRPSRSIWPTPRPHPSFKYLPETGEEIYHVLPRRAAPAGRHGRSACWSCRTARSGIYTEEEEEALQTTAMVLAEVIASGELQAARAPVEAGRRASARRSSARAKRWPTALALGHVVLHEPRVVVTNLIAESIPKREAAARGGDRGAAPAGRRADRAQRRRAARRASRGAGNLPHVRP